MQFQTHVTIPTYKKPITHLRPTLFIGSCFTENIGNYFSYHKLPSLINPYGIIYNPASVSSGIVRILEQRKFNEADLHDINDAWISMEHHSRFAHPDKQKALLQMNNSIKEAFDVIQNASHLLITLGTSWVYEHVELQKIVSNCHKIPARNFTRRSLSVSEIVSTLDAMHQKLSMINPELEIVYTVSPVRHWKDGAHENQLSKASLLLAIHELQKNHVHTSYFPAYEIMMDELRDYRFYDNDMLHPNSTAIAYIWERFSETFFEAKTLNLIKEIDSIRKALNHRPFNPKGASHQHFLQNLSEKITALHNKHSYLDLSDFTQQVQKQVDASLLTELNE